MKKKINTLEKLYHTATSHLHTLTIAIAVLLGATRVNAQLVTSRSPAPDAAAMARYTDIAVNTSTGIPGISIPLYSYKGLSNNLQLQLGLSYYAGGIRVSDPGTSYGYNWSMPIGVISRIVKGQPDDPAKGFDGSKFSVSGGFDPLGTTNDPEPDIYTYNFGSNNGRFMIPAANGGVPLLSQQCGLKITYNKTTGNFEATDTKGVKYIFAAKEFWLDESLTGTQTQDFNNWVKDATNLNKDKNAYVAFPDSKFYISSWYITQIISPNGTDVISFDYGKPYPDLIANSYAVNVASAGYAVPADKKQKFQTVSLNKITFPDGTILTFDYGNRTDCENGKYLTKITVNNKRVFSFGYKYLNNRLTLTSLSEGAGDYDKPPYRFTYNEGTLPATTSTQTDYWGFYNGGVNYNNINPATVANGTLTAIQYPTGSITDFEYECNDAYIPGSGTQLTGGLRIKKTRSRIPGTQTVQTREYTYKTAAGTTSGVCPKYTDIVMQNLVSGRPYYSPESDPVYYSRVEVKDSAGQGKTVYQYDAPFAGFVPPGESNILPSADVPVWSCGNLTYREVYDNAGRLVDRTENTYNYFLNTFKGDSRYNGYVLWSHSGSLSISCTYTKTTGRAELAASNHTQYTYTGSSQTADNTLTEKKSFLYDATGFNLKRTTIETGDDVLTTDYNYAYDLSGNNAAYALMQDRNITEAPVEVTTARNGIQTQKTRTEYLQWGSIMKPSKIYQVNGPVSITSADVVQQFNNYDTKGNLLEAAKTGNLPQTVLWGYNYTYPVVNISNATYSEASAIVSAAELNSCATDADIRAKIDKLRNALPRAQVSGSTYNKEGGVTSEMNANGRIMYYEYDDLNRPITVRDHNSNVLKSYCYQYDGTQTDCNKMYYSAGVSGAIIRRNNCPAGKYGLSMKAPDVPAAKYRSSLSQEAANAKAYAEADLYNQDYANANCGCWDPGNVYIKNNSANYMGVLLYGGNYPSYSLGPNDYSYLIPPYGSVSAGNIPPGFYQVFSLTASQGCDSWFSNLSACNNWNINHQFWIDVANSNPPGLPNEYPTWGQIPGNPALTASYQNPGIHLYKYNGYFQTTDPIWFGGGFVTNVTIDAASSGGGYTPPPPSGDPGKDDHPPVKVGF